MALLAVSKLFLNFLHSGVVGTQNFNCLCILCLYTRPFTLHISLYTFCTPSPRTLCLARVQIIKLEKILHCWLLKSTCNKCVTQGCYHSHYTFTPRMIEQNPMFKGVKLFNRNMKSKSIVSLLNLCTQVLSFRRFMKNLSGTANREFFYFK